MIETKSFLRGAWVAGTQKGRPIQDPTRATDIALVDSTGLDFAGAVRFAREAGGANLRGLTFAARAKILEALSAAIHGHRDELIALSAQNGGSTRGDAKFDIDGASGTLTAYAKLGKSLGEASHLPDGDGIQLGRTARYWGQHVYLTRPGVAVHVNAFNFPVWGMCEKLACSLLAGVPAISKPGTPTALIAYRAAQIMVESGALPEGSFQFVSGSLGDTLDHLGAQDVLAFTGSAKTGALLKSHARLIGTNCRVTLEADSLNAAVLGPDVDEDSPTWAAFLNNLATDITQKTGQKCTAVRRIFVPRDRVANVVEALVERLGRIAIGDPADESTNMGPVASASQWQDVTRGIESLAAVGKLACGGTQKVRDTGYFVAPTLLIASDPTAAVLHELEVFGPCASILPCNEDAETMGDLVNRGGGSLVASLYSNDKAWTESMIERIGPWHGRLWIASDKVADQAFAPGMVLPTTVHGGPGRAGGGEELGGVRGLELYMQRVALQGDQGHLARRYGPSKDA
ncbi:MAG: 3,4-dehydroadipyl-CoA semialdehyde dehydrogenase [Planctomycetota bacterium]